MTEPILDDSAAASLQALERAIARHDDLVVAFSGGVDSAVLLAAAHRVLGSRCVAFTADSPSMAREELAAARELAARIGVEHVVVGTDELDRPEYARNDRDRCYWCKRTLFDTADVFMAARGFRNVAYGYTADDVGDVRPGHRAAAESGVHAPLFEAGLGKPQIRAVARLLGLEVAEKPAAPCLASRIPFGSAVTTAKLAGIEQMESLLHRLGFAVCRARFDGETMRLEFEREQIPRASAPDVREAVDALALSLGVRRVIVDPEGFRSGKLHSLRTPDELSRTT